MRPSSALPLLALLVGCETAPQPRPDPAPPVQVAPQAAARAPEKKAYGDPISPAVELVALADLLKSPQRYADKTIRTEGEITAVCQGRGCWLELGDDKSAAHVKLGNHRFFVPRNSAGQHAVVQARVQAQVDKGHCEQEAEEQTGQVAKVELDATGVELSRLP